jgi:Flp pilus assembly protein TadB
MTILLDIATLAALLLALTFVPLHALRADRKITREIREARQIREAREARTRARARAREDQPDRKTRVHPGQETEPARARKLSLPGV